MINFLYLFQRFQRRTLLIAVAIFLLAIYAFMWVNDAYEARQIELENMLNRLSQYRLVTAKADIYEKRLQDLLKRKEQVDRYFFEGENDNKLSSAMQLKIQALVAKAGLQAESIRPVLQKNEGQEDNDNGYVLGEVLIKTRLSGTLSQLTNFMAGLYRSEKFFGIESVSLRPYRDTGLKIFLELRGYYVLSEDEVGKEEKEN